MWRVNIELKDDIPRTCLDFLEGLSFVHLNYISAFKHWAMLFIQTLSISFYYKYFIFLRFMLFHDWVDFPFFSLIVIYKGDWNFIAMFQKSPESLNPYMN